MKDGPSADMLGGATKEALILQDFRMGEPYAVKPHNLIRRILCELKYLSNKEGEIKPRFAE